MISILKAVSDQTDPASTICSIVPDEISSPIPRQQSSSQRKHRHRRRHRRNCEIKYRTCFQSHLPWQLSTRSRRPQLLMGILSIEHSYSHFSIFSAIWWREIRCGLILFNVQENLWIKEEEINNSNSMTDHYLIIAPHRPHRPLDPKERYAIFLCDEKRCKTRYGSLRA